jgi:protoporphyrinogen oxidase
MPDREIIIIGGGPAGLTAAYELSKFNLRPIVLEHRPRVGGLASTHVYKGFHFDMGGHRFFTKAEEVRKMWDEVLREDFLLRPRLSRIFYNGRFFYYPLRPFNALRGLGIGQSFFVALSYLWWQLFRYRQENTFEQ